MRTDDHDSSDSLFRRLIEPKVFFVVAVAIFLYGVKCILFEEGKIIGHRPVPTFWIEVRGQRAVWGGISYILLGISVYLTGRPIDETDESILFLAVWNLVRVTLFFGIFGFLFAASGFV